MIRSGVFGARDASGEVLGESSPLQTRSFNRSTVTKTALVMIALMPLAMAATIYTLTKLGDKNGWAVIGLSGALALETVVFAHNALSPEKRVLPNLAATMLAYAVFFVVWEIFAQTGAAPVPKWILLGAVTVFFACLMTNKYRTLKEVWAAVRNPDFIPLQSTMGEQSDDNSAGSHLAWYNFKTSQTVPYCALQAACVVLGGALYGGGNYTPAPLNQAISTLSFFLMGAGGGALTSKAFAALRDLGQRDAVANWSIQTVHQLPLGTREKVFLIVDTLIREIVVTSAPFAAAYALSQNKPVMAAVGGVVGYENHSVARDFERHRIRPVDSASENLQNMSRWVGRGTALFFGVGLALYGGAVDVVYQDFFTIISSLSTWGSFGLFYAGSKAIEHAWDPVQSGLFLNWLQLYVNENPAMLAYLAAILNHAADLPGMQFATVLDQFSLVAASGCLALDIARIDNFKRIRWEKIDHSPMATIAYLRALFIVWLAKHAV